MINQKQIFHLSIALIIGYWVYHLVAIFLGPPTIPDETLMLILRIVALKASIFLVLYLLLKGQGDRFESLGWNPQAMARQTLKGMGFGVVIFVLINILLNPIIALFWESENSDDILIHFKDATYLPVWMLLSILGGGLVEEFQRIFILTRFEKWKGKDFLILALIIDVITFGIGHLYQGIDGAITTGMAGLLYALVYLRKRSFLEAVVAHATYDVIAVIIAYFMMQ